MRAIIDPELCTGCGLCVDTCPEVFEMDSDLAKVKVDAVPPEAAETCRSAMQDCPVEAISIED
ncbi:MAG: ferredoxin [Kiritimatiellia bacterium]|nr:ferredoxin [Lentisphaerota bacterium]